MYKREVERKSNIVIVAIKWEFRNVEKLTRVKGNDSVRKGNLG